jgi:hypothetical protein
MALRVQLAYHHGVEVGRLSRQARSPLAQNERWLDLDDAEAKIGRRTVRCTSSTTPSPEDDQANALADATASPSRMRAVAWHRGEIARVDRAHRRVLLPWFF